MGGIGIGLLAGCRYSPNALRSTDGISSAGWTVTRPGNTTRYPR